MPSNTPDPRLDQAQQAQTDQDPMMQSMKELQEWVEKTNNALTGGIKNMVGLGGGKDDSSKDKDDEKSAKKEDKSDNSPASLSPLDVDSMVPNPMKMLSMGGGGDSGDGKSKSPLDSFGEMAGKFNPGQAGGSAFTQGGGSSLTQTVEANPELVQAAMIL